MRLLKVKVEKIVQTFPGEEKFRLRIKLSEVQEA